MVNKKLGKLAHSSGKDSKDDKTALQISPGIFLPCEAGLNPRSPGSRHSPRWLLSSPPSLPDKKKTWFFLFKLLIITWSWTMAAKSLNIWLTSPMSASSWATLLSLSCKYSRFCSSSNISWKQGKHVLDSSGGRDTTNTREMEVFYLIPLYDVNTCVLFCPSSISIRFAPPPPSPGGTCNIL